MPRDFTQDLSSKIDSHTYEDQHKTLARLIEEAALSDSARLEIVERAAKLVRDIRDTSDPGLMEIFLAEYGLSTDEGIALMCLAEALLRVPDPETIDILIEDKIAPSDWSRHLGHSASPLVNASTWALLLTGRVLDEGKPGISKTLRGAIKRLGEPVIRSAVARAMREMGRQFVLGETIEKAMLRAERMQSKGFTYSYDMLGEAARTDKDARTYQLAYSRAISTIAAHCNSEHVRENPGISVKLSALHPRYEVAQRDRVMNELVPRVRALAQLARAAGMGFNIDAEEADRLSLSLEVIESVLSDPSLAGWEGFGVVVQAYGQRAGHTIDWLHALAERLDRKIMIRLVKGAYWDAEIKRAQVEGMSGFPVFTNKAATDISYIANARKLLGVTDRIYPQFATHNAHTVAAILKIAEQEVVTKEQFEFQRLHGMGETLHTLVLNEDKTACRIYAPVGAHEDLLAYLVRRLLENGANSSFVNQIVDQSVPAEVVAACPFEKVTLAHPISTGEALFAPKRQNSKGWDITHIPTLNAIEKKRAQFEAEPFSAGPVLATPSDRAQAQPVFNPAKGDLIGNVSSASRNDCTAAHEAARVWDAPKAERQTVLNRAADLYEANAEMLFALLAREAGKTLADAVGEVREAVDFLRYYAAEIPDGDARGNWVCISPWNFPLAIFTGQIAAALATGNAVLAKPAGQTPLIAFEAVKLLLEAGVPHSALQLLPGEGDVGAALVSDSRVKGVAFTGSTATALKIRASMAEHCVSGTPLIAETGGLNAMIVDSTALPEHAVRDVLLSSFRSAGQRCSALRCLYVQEDIAPKVLKMLKGAMNELTIGDPILLSTDVGPVIDIAAQSNIAEHIATARSEGRILHELQAPTNGTFIAPTVIQVQSIRDLEREIFGPVLHLATFKADQIEQVIEDINATGYGLTFGLHTRIDSRVEEIVSKVNCGNIYVNRNQIGAVVGSQPFGGEGLSGTGPKAGGPHYLARFIEPKANPTKENWSNQGDVNELERALQNQSLPVPVNITSLPGPTGESNRLSEVPRTGVVCLGPTPQAVEAQVAAVERLGGIAIATKGMFDPEQIATLPKLSAVIWWGDEPTAKAIEGALAMRTGPIVPLIRALPDAGHVLNERHTCIDTTAAGGNAALLAEVSQ